MTETTSDQETESLTEEEVEPKLKYVRLTNDLQNILNKDAVSCIAVHPKFLCLGTHWGAVHLLDHQGNVVSLNCKKNFQTHMVSVNQISVDLKGEFIATCSDDRMVLINGLYTDDNQQKLTMTQDVKSVALDPYYYKPGSGKRFVVGDKNLTLYERTFLKGLKATHLGSTEGFVTGIAWSEQWIAWASNSLGVRVYDLNERSSLGLIRWEEPKGTSLSDFRCNLRWSTPETLLIGWCDTIRICIIRKRNAVEVSTRNMPVFIVDPISTFQTDFYISGIAPLDSNQLVVLGYPKEKDSDTNKALRPILSVLQYNTSDYTEICTDSLSIRGYQEYSCNDYHLDCLIDENQYFIVSPKDIVVASRYDTDDRVEWLIQHEKFVQAMDVISTEGGKYSLTSVSRLYLDHLLSLNQYDEAAKVCLTAFGNDKALWEEEVYKFVKVQQLRSVSAYLPRTMECKLNPHVYEMVLYEYLHLDKKGFLSLIKEWNPQLYNTQAVINAIHDHMNDNDKNILLEALAILYSHEKNYKRALEYYLDLKHKDVFDLIKTHDLCNSIHSMIIRLIELDSDKAIALLLDNSKISSDIVVKQLQSRQDFLYLYLEALDRVKNSAGKYHEELVNLYAKFAPDKLLPFLKKSHSYPIQKALDICKRETFYPEMVYLYDRMGNPKEALSIIINQIKNTQTAIDFCKENNDIELWNYLIDKSLNKPEIMTKLLDGIVGYVNPEILINKIKFGQEIPGLKNSIIKMLCDYSLQVSIQNGCNEILATDYFNLVQKVVKNQKRAHYVSSDIPCQLCRRDIIIKDPLKTDIVAFNCHHFFHETCLPDKFNLDFCIVCHSKKQISSNFKEN